VALWLLVGIVVIVRGYGSVVVICDTIVKRVNLLMSDILEGLLAECEGQTELAPLWATGDELAGYTRALSEVIGLIREQIQIEKLGE
jgi:hypothetical protein